MRWWRTVLVAAGLAGLLTVAAPGSAWACDCRLLTMAEGLAEPSTVEVFTGTVLGRETTTTAEFSADLVPWTFAVDAVHRGMVGPLTTVWSPSWQRACGVEFTVGQRLLVLAALDDTGRTTTRLCDPIVPVDELSADDRTLLGPGRLPLAAPDPPVTFAGTASPRPTPVMSDAEASGEPADRTLVPALSVVAAALVALSVGGRRRRRSGATVGDGTSVRDAEGGI